MFSSLCSQAKTPIIPDPFCIPRLQCSQTLYFKTPMFPDPLFQSLNCMFQGPLFPDIIPPYLPGPFIQKVYPQTWQICSFNLYSTAPMLPGTNVFLVTLDLGIKGLTPTLEKALIAIIKSDMAGVRYSRCKFLTWIVKWCLPKIHVNNHKTLDFAEWS